LALAGRERVVVEQALSVATGRQDSLAQEALVGLGFLQTLLVLELSEQVAAVAAVTIATQTQVELEVTVVEEEAAVEFLVVL
jgi:hypothetical protein